MKSADILPVEPGLLASVAGFLGAIIERIAPLLTLCALLFVVGYWVETFREPHWWGDTQRLFRGSLMLAFVYGGCRAFLWEPKP